MISPEISIFGRAIIAIVDTVPRKALVSRASDNAFVSCSTFGVCSLQTGFHHVVIARVVILRLISA